MRRLRTFLLTAALAVGALPLASLAADAPASSSDADFDVVDLVPQDPPAWTPANLLAPITGLFLGGPGYWYAPRIVEIETTPPGALLDLFYVRRNFQKRYEQADAPARVILPSRIEATDRDNLTVRALLDGYRQKEVQIPVRSRQERVMIDLSPLPNTLVGFSASYFADRDTLTFLTQEALTFRLQRSGDVLSVVLTETAGSPAATAAMQGVSDPLVDAVVPQQLGEDLMVRVDLSERGAAPAYEARSRQGVDPVRGIHRFSLDLTPKGGDAESVEEARAALARLDTSDVTGCALEFDTALREQMDPADLARALTPTGAYTDKYTRAAMRRLGEVSPGGVIRMRDGGSFRADVPIELMAAASQPGEALGYLALLRSFVAQLTPPEHRDGTLRGLIAPEMSPAAFAGMLGRAAQREAACRSRG